MEIIASKSQRSKMKPYCHISTHNAIHHQLQLQGKSRSQYLSTSLFFPHTVHWSYHSGCEVNRKTDCTVLILKLGNGNEISVESTDRMKLQARTDGGSDISKVLILYLKDKQAALVRVSQSKQPGRLHVSWVFTAFCSLANNKFHNAPCVCVCFCIRGQNGCQDGGGKYFSHRFHNVTVKAADKTKHIWEADRDFCTKCHSSLMDVVCSGPKKHC